MADRKGNQVNFMKKDIKKILFFYAVLFSVLYVPLILWLRNKSVFVPFQFFTSDTFYYLSIARHSVNSLFYTSDGMFPTNGFHPLWGFLLTKLFSIPFFSSHLDMQIYLTIILSLVFVTFGTIFFGMTIYHLTDNAAVSLLAAVPGYYYLIFASLVPNYNSTWAYINGMESPLSIFWFGLFLYLLVNKKLLLDQRLYMTVILSIVVTLIVFSRLDDVFLLIPFWILLFFFSEPRKKAVARLLIAIGIPVLSLIAYMVYNYSYTESAMPVSGLIKNGNWLLVNLAFFITTFFPIQLVNHDAIWSETSMRSLQTAIPILTAALWLLFWRKNTKLQDWQSIPQDNYTIISALAVYMIIKGGYNFVLVYLMGQGHWYYSISIMLFNLMMGIVIVVPLRNISSQSQRIWISIAAFLLVILMGNVFINNKIQSKYNVGYYELWLQSEKVNSLLKETAPDIKLVEYDDGIIAYLLNLPVMNGFGFTLDKEAMQAQTEGHLLNLAYERGFRTIAVMSYVNFPDDFENDSDQIREQLRKMPGIGFEDLDQWDFGFLYRDDKSSMVLINYEPRIGQ